MRDRLYLFLIVLVSFLPVISFFTTPLLPHTHDGLVHLPRIAAFHKALLDGQLPVRWAGDLNYGYGLPLFNYIYQLPYLLSSLFLYFNFGLVDSFKITLALSYLLSGVFMYLFAKELFKNSKYAFLVAVFYQFFPFRLVELLVRGSFGEVYTYTFLPLVLYGVQKYINTRSKWSFILTSVSTGLLVLSHNSVSLLFFGTVVLYVLFFGNKKEIIIRCLLALGIGLLLSMFYWFPAISDHKYTYGNLHMKDLYKEHFAPLLHFFIPNLTNSPSLQTGGVAIGIGFMHTVAIVLGIILFRNKKINPHLKKILLFSFVLLAVSFFFMQSLSQAVWEAISYLRQFQFPWRFLAIVALATSLLSVSIAYKIKNETYYWIIIGITVLSTFMYWKPSLGYDAVSEKYYWNFPLDTTYYGETDLIWSAGGAQNYAKSPVEFVSGRGEVKDFTKKSNLHTFKVIAENDSVVVDNTQYFPGWEAYVDGKEVQIQFQDLNWRGLITLPVSKGTHEVTVRFGETKPHLAADLISVTSFIALIFLGLYKRKII